MKNNPLSSDAYYSRVDLAKFASWNKLSNGDYCTWLKNADTEVEVHERIILTIGTYVCFCDEGQYYRVVMSHYHYSLTLYIKESLIYHNKTCMLYIQIQKKSISSRRMHTYGFPIDS